MFRSLLQTWFKSMARAKVRQAAFDKAKECLSEKVGESEKSAMEECSLGVVFALSIEAGCLADILTDVTTLRGRGFVVKEGCLRNHRVAAIYCGPGNRNATRATELLIEGHRPKMVIAAGLAGGLSPQLKVGDLLLAERLLFAGDEPLDIALPPELVAMSRQREVYSGTLLTLERPVRSSAEKQALWRQWGALAVDMESFAVLKECRRRGVACYALRAVSDTAADELPVEVERLLAQPTAAGRWGAALGITLHRPSALKELYRLRENALVAADRLAHFLAALCSQ